MTPKGFFKIFSPFMGMMGAKNLRDTANALQRYLTVILRSNNP
jgi:hypothetical protein